MHSRIPLNLVAVSSLALLISSFSATPVTAVSVSSHGHVVARHQAVAANSIAKKKKRSSSGRCKPRSTSAASHSSTAKSSTATKSSTSSSNTKGSTSSNSNSNSNSGSTGKGSTVPVNGGGATNSNGQKVGIAWPNGESSDLKFYKTSHSKFLYTWSPFIPDNAKSLGFTPMPMLWGRNQVDDFKRLVKPGYADYVLGMNEPNQSGQSDMSPQEGASLWKQYIQPLKAHGYKLISPATTSAPSGKQWMKDFFAACDGCTFDGLAIHYYDVDPQGMIDYMTDFHNTFKLDIWPTEFACQNFNGGAQKSAGEVQNFLQTVTAFMEKTDWIPAYFAFGVMHDMQGVNTDNQLMAGSGKPTTLGNIYLNP